MEKLLTLQKLELDARSLAPEQETERENLRGQVPAPILAHFDRLVSRGKKGVAITRHGACGECHLRLPSGTLAALAYTNDVHLCDNCGRYLYLPENESLGLADSAPPVKTASKYSGKRTRQKADLRAV